MSWMRFVVFLGFAALVGCGGGPSSVDVTPLPEETPVQAITTVLEGLAADGQFAPGMESLDENIEKLKATDAEKAGALEEDWKALQSLSDPEAIQAKAKEMLGTL
ncbi:MAG: hypothetical protein ABIP48_14065 [Planctomycetota bacterium]